MILFVNILLLLTSFSLLVLFIDIATLLSFCSSFSGLIFSLFLINRCWTISWCNLSLFILSLICLSWLFTALSYFSVFFSLFMVSYCFVSNLLALFFNVLNFLSVFNFKMLAVALFCFSLIFFHCEFLWLIFFTFTSAVIKDFLIFSFLVIFLIHSSFICFLNSLAYIFISNDCFISEAFFIVCCSNLFGCLAKHFVELLM